MAVRKRHEEPENNERWLVSYADFITLLFAFFVVLYATSQADVKKQEEFEESIKKSFSSYIGVGGGGSQFDELNDTRNNSFIRPPMETFPRAGSATQEVEKHVENQLDESISDAEKNASGLEVYHDSVGVRIQLATAKIFPSGSANLIAGSTAALDAVAKVLKESNRRIIVEGHTDDIPIRNELYPSNWELSAARATKIVRYLAAQHKIPQSRMTAVAYADQKPVAANTSSANRARNRRIEIMIVTGNSDIQ